MADEHRVLIAQAIVAIDDPKATAGDVLDALHALSKERAQLFIDLTDPPTPVHYELGGLVGEGLDADEAALSLGKEYRAPLVDLSALKDLPPTVDIAVESRAAIERAQAAEIEAARAEADRIADEKAAAERKAAADREPVVVEPSDVGDLAAVLADETPVAKEG